MFKFIKLSMIVGDKTKPVFIQVAHIGHVVESETEKYTNVGVTTHNNGGFKVKETAGQIMKIISTGDALI